MEATSVTTGNKMETQSHHIKNVRGSAPPTKRLGIDTILGALKIILKKTLGNNTLMQRTFVGDVAINALYKTFANAPNQNQALVRGALAGLGVGLAAVLIDRGFEQKTKQQNFFQEKAGILALYMVGGLTVAALVNYLESQKVTKLPPM